MAKQQHVATATDYRLVCRTCLASDVEFYKLEAAIAVEEDDEKISFMECLRYCTRLDDAPPQFPIYICTECSSALQVTYNFIRNAIEAHEILRQKLCPLQRRNNGGLQLQQQPQRSSHGVSESSSVNKFSAVGNAVDQQQQRIMRYRCKICGEKVETKKSLKDHVKLHLDIISYCCQLCNFESKKRSHLSEHYKLIHGIEATHEQLKPTTNHQPPIIHNVCAEEFVKEELIKEEFIHEDVYKDFETFPIEEQSQHYQQHHQHQEQQLLHNQEQQLLQHQEQQLLQHQDQLDMATVITSDSNDFNTGIATEMHDFGNEFNMANEMSVGNEFIVMADGTVEEVMGNGVVIEYINAANDGITLENDIVLNNIVQMSPDDVNATEMDVDDIIIEESVGAEVVEEERCIEDEIPPAIIQVSNNNNNNNGNSLKKIRCKICANFFSTQEELKTHMLTHNEIPHFFCDQCTFYTFFKIDLTQHYKTKHKLQPTYKQLQPKNKIKSNEDIMGKNIYSCDLCLYETNTKMNLRRHYSCKHDVVANEVQLRPAADFSQLKPTVAPAVTLSNVKNVRLIRPDYPNGLNCKKCNKLFYWRNKLKEHYKRHNLEENTNQSLNAVQSTTKSNDNHTLTTTAKSTTTACVMASQIDNISTTHTTYSTTNTPAASTHQTFTIPSDAIPQIVETDNVIDNEIDFDFNGDAIFEDFDEDEDDNEHENDTEEFQDLLLTSEDDFEDTMEEQPNDIVSNNVQHHPYCIQCSKTFFSQYQFENHMFVHRGLAPYRCEMCTNLYNTKRALIRHYKAVHKNIPTRDMIQAKGDKVTVDRTPVEHLNLEERQATTLMCSKCPYESTERHNLQIHINTSHGITDENYILQKLPFECPRCIRSYETKARLIRHLERSHSVATIIQPRQTITPFIAGSSSCSSTSGIVELEQAALNNITTTTTAKTTKYHRSSKETIADGTTTATQKDAEILGKDENPHYKCNACNFSCRSIETLDEHSKWHDANSMARDNFNFVCEVCQCRYKSIMLLKHHMKRHMERKYHCNHCSKSYINRSELENHKLCHTGELPHHCDICTKRFRYSHHLKRHKDVQHFGMRHACQVDGCDRTFTTQAQLKIHAWNHNGNIPYKCNNCDRTFKKRELLRQHARKIHQINLTEAEIAEIYRNTNGYTNPHDFTVAVSNGEMLRRCDLEAVVAATTASTSCIVDPVQDGFEEGAWHENSNGS